MTQSQIFSVDDITIEDMGCCNHPGVPEKCVQFEGGKHKSEVNLCNYVEGGPVMWRLECASCMTVLKIFSTYDEAIRAGKNHAVYPSVYYPPWFGIYDEESDD